MLFPPQRPRFSAALRDVSAKTPRARALAAASLADPPEGREDEAKAGLRILADDPDPEVRGAALAGLGRLRDADALDLIVARFDDGDPVVRQIAIIAAADVGDRRAVAPLVRALSDERPDVRFQAAASLATLAPDEAARPLARLVEDPDPEVRAQL
ncbi:MAG TPA: HEAT repeat domain-containing protein, partial [Sandaracinaceae bacterium]